MFIPKGSLRDGAINDAVSDAKRRRFVRLLQLAAFALAAVTFIPSRARRWASRRASARSGLLAHYAVEEWELYSNEKVLSNTHIDLARSLATEEPSLTGFAFSLAGLGLELLPLAGAFNRARKLRKLVVEGKETTVDARRLLKELDELGSDHGAPDLGKRALAEIHGTPSPRATPARRRPAPRSRTEEELAQTLGKQRQRAGPYNRRPPKGAPAPRVGPHVPVKPAAQRMLEGAVTKAAFDATEAGADNWAQFLNYSKAKGQLKDVDLSKLTKAEIKELRKAYNEGAAAARKLGKKPPRPPKGPPVSGTPRAASIPAPPIRSLRSSRARPTRERSGGAGSTASRSRRSVTTRRSR